MLDSDNSLEYMKELYDRFRREVLEEKTVDYYEEDELLDIYDYAQDEGDVMVQFYVFLTARRLHPDSTLFDERAGFFLSYISNDAGADMLARRQREESPLWDVLALSIAHYPGGHPDDDMRALLAKHEKFDCESVLKLMDLLRDLTRPDLVAEAYIALRDKAEDTRSLLFETATILKDYPDHSALARQLAEELTQTEPFNVDCWLLLAKTEFANSHLDEAVSAADYALAIDPENLEGALVRAVVLSASDNTREQAEEELKAFLRRVPDNPIATKALAECYRGRHKDSAAIETYASFMAKGDEGNPEAILEILRLKPENPAPYIDIYNSLVGDDTEQWHKSALTLYNENLYAQGADLLDYHTEKYGFTTLSELYLRMLYLSGRYADYIRRFEQLNVYRAENDPSSIEISVMGYLLLCASLLKEHRFADLDQLSSVILANPPQIADIEDVMKFKGIQLTLQQMRILASHEAYALIDEPGFDPARQLFPFGTPEDNPFAGEADTEKAEGDQE
ncbi:MAG: hypothetical protein NC210_00205 [[Clostridium] fimetarium]|nr:hypothetical protein [Alistipes timonensis]MCM1404825.1 hypothetical protein [[Clostridium] fimetarium]